jgi:hypothetical protein
MEESTSINAKIVDTSTNGVFTSVVEAAGVGKITPEEFAESKPKRNLRDWIIICLRAYGAVLVAGLPIVPIIASAVTLALYFSGFTQTTASWYAVVYGILYTYIAWWVIAVPCSVLTTARLMNTGSYGLLTCRLSQLEARLHEINTPDQNGKPKHWADYQLVALKEARDQVEELNSQLHGYPAGLQWALGLGYVNAWSKLHRAEEALIEVEPVEMVIRGALHDKLSIQDSKIKSRDELLEKLHWVARELYPAMESNFKTYQPREGHEEINKLFYYVKKIALKAGVDVDVELSQVGNVNQAISAEVEARARFTAREVRRILNEFRDRLWEGLIRARNHLLSTIFVTGFVTHILLCIAILAGASTSANRDAIIAAAVFYIVGAIAGLFGRIYRESQTSTAVDDYGLSLARLVATPLLSGLAGVGGVLLINTVLFGTSMTASNTALQNIFNVNRVDYIIAAAIFGLAPNLIVRSLEQRSQKYISALQSSKGAERDDGRDGGA